jgi:hypothetical protein
MASKYIYLHCSKLYAGMVKIYILVVIIVCYTGINGFAQTSLLTLAEKSGYKSTSDYKDVMNFIEQLKDKYTNIRVETIANSTEGRDIPLLIIGRPLPDNPEALANDPRIVVYIQANIHAGEVEGKEATLMFARDILKGDKSKLLDNVVLLICPIFNPDGNEKISTQNRTDQNGPVNGVGVRYNGQFLDLNRDAMKSESPETRGLLKNVFNRWDPSVFMDCHTTNGSYHIEPVTFTWMVNPNGDKSLIDYMRDKMMPEISRTLLTEYKVENCFYGEFYNMANPEEGWVMDASEPRYMVNYYGLRNRLSILNENYVYADFRSRVLGCYDLIHSLLDYASANRGEIKQLISKADQRTISRGKVPAPKDSFAVEYRVKPAHKKVTIKTYDAELVSETDGWKNYKKGQKQKTVTVPYFNEYFPVRSVQLPFAYILKVSDPEITDLLRNHGINLEKLSEDSKIEVESFVVSELHVAPRLNQGHYINSIKGSYSDGTVDFPAGTIVIRMAQPLANVAACLLEPESDDGLLVWNFLDRYLVPQWGSGYNQYPVCKIMKNTCLRTTRF